MRKERLEEYEAMLKAKRVTKETGRKVYFYHCDVCKKYHISSMERS